MSVYSLRVKYQLITYAHIITKYKKKEVYTLYYRKPHCVTFIIGTRAIHLH